MSAPHPMSEEELQTIEDRLRATDIDPWHIEIKPGCVPALLAEARRSRTELARAVQLLTDIVAPSHQREIPLHEDFAAAREFLARLPAEKS